jgi:hypothetical protein
MESQIDQQITELETWELLAKLVLPELAGV